MRTTVKRTLALAALGALFGLVAAPAPASFADTVDPDMQTSGWYSRPKPRSPSVDLPGVGSVSPGPEVPPDPRAAEGSYVVASGGGQPGETDTAWSAFQWDTFVALGGTVDTFVVTLTRSPDARGDYGTGYADILRACNIVVAWAAAPTANAWQDRPTADCTQAVAPTVDSDTFTFDLTSYAQKWVDGEAFGVVIRPGDADAPDSEIIPFQVTFAADTHPNPDLRPKVEFEFTAGSTDLGGPIVPPDFGGGFGGGFDDGGSFEPAPDLDVFPNDVGSEPDPVPADDPPVADGVDELPDETATPVPVSSEAGFPVLALLLMLLLAGTAFWGLGTALGPAGDPVPVREGGVSRLLAHRGDTSEPTGTL